MNNGQQACLRQNYFVTFKNFNYLKGNCFDSHCFLNSLMYSNSARDYPLKAKLGGEQEHCTKDFFMLEKDVHIKSSMLLTIP